MERKGNGQWREDSPTEASGNRPFDLEVRTLAFARNARSFVHELTRTLANVEDGIQLIRSSGSVGANYVEASESLSRKDFVLRIKICRKEARESGYWLKLISTPE